MISTTIHQLIRYYKVILWAFALTFFATIPMFVSVFHIFFSHTAHTSDAQVLLHGFDRTIIEDMFQGTDSLPTVLMSPFFISLILYIIASIIGQAGLIGLFVNEENGLRAFFKYALKYFLVFLAYAIIYLIMMGVVSFLVYLIYTSLLGDPILDHKTEKTLFYSSLGLIMWLILKAIAIWVWSVKTKYYFVRGNRFFKSIFLGLKSMVGHIGSSIYVALILLLTFMITWLAHNALIKMHSGQSWLNIFAIFIALQFILALKYFVKTWAIILIAPED